MKTPSEFIKHEAAAAQATTILAAVYERLWPQLAALTKGVEGVSNPLFLQVDSRYFEAKTKLMVIGQETFSWYGQFGFGGAAEPIKELQRVYKGFALGSNYRPSPFWRFSHALLEGLNPGADPPEMMWSNLNPVDVNRGRPYALEKELAKLQIVRQEVEILTPHVVVFLTGPQYDPLLTDHFPGAQQSEFDGHDARFLCRISHPSLPQVSYRTYHPAYLRRCRRFDEALGGILMHAAKFL